MLEERKPILMGENLRMCMDAAVCNCLIVTNDGRLSQDLLEQVFKVECLVEAHYNRLLQVSKGRHDMMSPLG